MTFAKVLLENKAFQVRYLADIYIKDMRTVMGKTLVNIRELFNEDRDIRAISAKRDKDCVHYAPILPSEAWRIGLIKELLEMKDCLKP